jgi:hypothetical protein
MTHLLTDEICHEIVDGKDCSKYRAEYTHYFVEDYMRAAADWQLEQVIEWIKECPNYDLDYHAECDRMIKDLKEAMRPQEDNC